MNIYDHRKEIERIQAAVETLRDVATTLSDAQNQMDNTGDISASESNITRLHIAADIANAVIPMAAMERAKAP